MRSTLWRAMLDADFNSRYWSDITQKYIQRDFVLKIALAVSASGSVAGWAIWGEWPLAWKILSGASALASIASPLLAYGKKVETAAGHAGLWADLRIRYDDLWELYQSKGESEPLRREHARLRKIFLQLEVKEPKLKIPKDQKLARKVQQEVLVARELKGAPS